MSIYYVEAESTEREYGHLAKVLDSFENFSGLPQLQVTETQLQLALNEGGSGDFVCWFVGLEEMAVNRPQTWSDPALSSVCPHLLAVYPLCGHSQLSAAPIPSCHRPPHSQRRQAANESVFCHPRLVTLEKMDVLVSWDCHSKMPYSGLNNRHLFLPVLEAVSLRSGAAWLILGGGPLPPWAFLVTAETPCLPFIRASILSWGPHPHDVINPNYLQKAPPPNIIPLGVRGFNI